MASPGKLDLNFKRYPKHNLFYKGLLMDLSNRHYSKQSHMLVNAKYALTKMKSI